jgi:hypothetical protein
MARKAKSTNKKALYCAEGFSFDFDPEQKPHAFGMGSRLI